MIKSFLLNKKKNILLLASIGFAQAGVNVVSAVSVKNIFDDFLLVGDQSNNNKLFIYAALLAIAAIVGGYLIYAERYQSENLGQILIHKIRLKLFQHITKVPPRVLGGTNKGGLGLRLVNDLTAIRQWITFGLSRVLISGLSIVFTLCALIFIDPILAGLVCLFVLIGVVGALFLGIPLERKVAETRNRRGILANNIGEKLNSMASIQVFGRQRTEQNRVRKQSNKVVAAILGKARYVGALRGMVGGLLGLTSMAVLVVGTYLVSADKTTAGTVVAAISLLGFLLPPLRDFGRAYEYWVAYKVALEKIQRTLSLETVKTISKKEKDKDLEGTITFENVFISPRLRNFSATVQANEKISITGANGIGKSSLLAMMLRAIRPEHGILKIDGIPIERISNQQLSEQIGIVGSNYPLLRGTLRKNILYRHPKIEDRDIIQAIIEMGLYDAYKCFPDGLNSRIAERGTNLSAGQLQTVTLIRALFGQPKILLLDEAENSLDLNTRKILLNIISNFKGTLLMVTNDPTFIRLSNHIWVLSENNYRITDQPTVVPMLPDKLQVY